MVLKNIAIIDGSFFLHRNLKQQNLWELRNSELERTGGIMGFLNTFQKELKLLNNYFPIVCWDDGQSDRRLSLYDNYKKHRDHIEDPDRKPFNEMTKDELDEDYVYNYKLQRKKLIGVLNSFGIPSLFFKHTEGDDLMWWLSNHCEKCIVLTDDRDLLQLLSEKCKVRQPMHDRTYTLESYLKENDFDNINDFIKQKALLGDGSDNIPSACKGVGEKTTKMFFETYDKLKELNCFDIIHDEKLLKKFCNDNDLTYRKAYTNFDETQYLLNLELVDLSKIQDSELNDEAIYDAIKRTYKNNDVMAPVHLLNRYEIKTVNTNVIFEKLVMTRFNIKA